MRATGSGSSTAGALESTRPQWTATKRERKIPTARNEYRSSVHSILSAYGLRERLPETYKLTKTEHVGDLPARFEKLRDEIHGLIEYEADRADADAWERWAIREYLDEAAALEAPGTTRRDRPEASPGTAHHEQSRQHL